MLAEHMARVVNRVVDLLDIRADLPEVGMVSLGLVAIDGTKVKAASSDYGTKIQGALKEALKLWRQT